jgi:N-acetylmuramoyl-L-alanine amidase
MAYHVGANKYTPRALAELSNYPNNCTLGIELCHINWEGEFTDATLAAAMYLVKNLCYKYKLARSNVYRHFDITGKDCPHYFVSHEDAWENFLDKIFLG